ncbi:leucyl aminopeptidase [Thermanaerovibrio velox DSM 12556]|uniref:Probable cytosol aminopeptidase n=1 Tax=Thermanaerovibrio velox DSM 12556 TaxID=926567 RepID=H0UNL3_9BACT|nr:leucyl aminopeptidase [Thermanaerovibrio velox]EHM10428.1 leucyl aminopeptidase [Thermanaerovibrio velox DSM 12556]
MKFFGLNGRSFPDDVKGIVVLLKEGEVVSSLGMPKEAADFTSLLAAAEGFNGKPKERALGVSPSGVWVALAGVGDGSSRNVMVASAEAMRSLASKGCSRVMVAASGLCDEGLSVAEGAVLGTYRFNRYRAKDKDDRFVVPDEVHVMGGQEQAMAEGAVLGESQNYTRDLANEPGNVVTPEELASRARDLAERFGCQVTVLDESAMKEKGMNAVLAVGMGSSNPPRFIHITRKVQSPKARVALIGKGLTFDSGGLNIKPGDSMKTMKGDKSGACAVLGAFLGACRLGLPLDLHVIIAAAENMPDGRAYRPDDIIKTYSGKTVEILNTDAEGRMTLVDAIAYACEQDVDYVVDIATLTGACAVALGENTAGLFSPDDGLAGELAEAFNRSGERVWRLPLDDETLREGIKSPVADLAQCGSRYGGAITAAMLLGEFVSGGKRWAHLDIAGVDVVNENRGHLVKGASGFGARSLIRWMKGLLA